LSVERFCFYEDIISCKHSHRSIFICPKQVLRGFASSVVCGDVASVKLDNFTVLVANISKTLHNNIYQNRSSIVKVMIKKPFGVFFASRCT